MKMRGWEKDKEGWLRFDLYNSEGVRRIDMAIDCTADRFRCCWSG